MKNKLHIYFIKQDEKLADEIFQQFLLQMPVLFRTEILKFSFWQGAESSLLGKMLLQYAFKNLKLKHTLADIKITEKDRPFINDEIDFNISHSGNYIICVIAENAKVGIDVEKHRTLKTNIADRYFDKNECHEIDTSEDATKSFFDLWSLKESAIKCDGRGVEVLSKTHKQYQIENLIKCDDVLLYYQALNIAQKYSCYVCSDKIFEVEIQELMLEDLLT